jgi:phage terminase large subunit-like protein
MVLVKHVNGKSRLQFKSYDSGASAWMGVAVDVVWMDEEPPQDIYSQSLRASLKNGGPVYLTFTPERGVTGVVQNFLNDRKPSQQLVTASWDDAPHLSEDVKQEILSALPLHERQMRSKGIPVLGSGQVFPIAEESFSVRAFEIPEHWPRICGIDFGFDHPTAAIWVAWDRDTDTAYLYDSYCQSGAAMLQHAEAIKLRGNWIPVAWPHDGSIHDKGSGYALADQYRRAGVNFLGSHFHNPEGGIAVEPGIMAMITRFQTGRLKVFDHLQDWYKEYRIYHRKDGKIVRKNDDLMSATRYAVQSLRYATVRTWRPRAEVAEGSLSDRTFDPFNHWRAWPEDTTPSPVWRN